jgi:hypothetical protein
LIRARQRQRKFTAHAAAAAREAAGPEPTDDEIVEVVKTTRETVYRERYGIVSSPECPNVGTLIPAEEHSEGRDG